jgi:hypothetical protein
MRARAGIGTRFGGYPVVDQPIFAMLVRLSKDFERRVHQVEQKQRCLAHWRVNGSLGPRGLIELRPYWMVEFRLCWS